MIDLSLDYHFLYTNDKRREVEATAGEETSMTTVALLSTTGPLTRPPKLFLLRGTQNFLAHINTTKLPHGSIKFRRDKFVKFRGLNWKRGKVLLAAKSGGGGDGSTLENHDNAQRRRLIQTILWIAEGVYVLWLFLLPYAPGDPVWRISSATVNDLLGLSLNFFFILPLSNIAFLIPYMAIRLNGAATDDDPRKSTSQLGSVMTRGARIVGLIGVGICLLSTFWAIFGRGDGNFGGISERWEFLMSYLGSERLAYAFIWDICLYTIFQPWLIGDNLQNIEKDKVGVVNYLRFVPVVGLAAYCLCLNLDDN
nr:uncharacterized protein LOC109216665 isoform X2 [Ipomoea trifida]